MPVIKPASRKVYDSPAANLGAVGYTRVRADSLLGRNPSKTALESGHQLSTPSPGGGDRASRAKLVVVQRTTCCTHTIQAPGWSGGTRALSQGWWGMSLSTRLAEIIPWRRRWRSSPINWLHCISDAKTKRHTRGRQGGCASAVLLEHKTIQALARRWPHWGQAGQLSKIWADPTRICSDDRAISLQSSGRCSDDRPDKQHLRTGYRALFFALFAGQPSREGGPQATLTSPSLSAAFPWTSLVTARPVRPQVLLPASVGSLDRPPGIFMVQSHHSSRGPGGSPAAVAAHGSQRLLGTTEAGWDSTAWTAWADFDACGCSSHDDQPTAARC